jgi:hypothetical protein
MIAIFFKVRFIRHTLGDFLVVIMLFYFFKSFLKTKSIYIAILVLLISYSIEFLQFIPILEILNFQHNKTLNTIFGTTFSVLDLIAYTLGVVTVLIIEKYLICSQFTN